MRTMTFGVLAEAILFIKEVYAVAERKGIHGELAGFMNLHSRLEMARFGGPDSTSPARDCRKLSHSTEVSSCSGPKDIGSCFCSLVFRPGPATFFGGRMTQTRISNGFVGTEGTRSGGAAAASSPINEFERASRTVASSRVTSPCTGSGTPNGSKKSH